MSIQYPSFKRALGVRLLTWCHVSLPIFAGSRVVAGGKRSFNACHRGRLRSRTLPHLRLCEPGLLPGHQQQVKKRALLALEAFNVLAHAGAAHELG
jgi:hypothetical protein